MLLRAGEIFAFDDKSARPITRSMSPFSCRKLLKIYCRAPNNLGFFFSALFHRKYRRKRISFRSPTPSAAFLRCVLVRMSLRELPVLLDVDDTCPRQGRADRLGSGQCILPQGCPWLCNDVLVPIDFGAKGNALDLPRATLLRTVAPSAFRANVCRST